MALLKYNNNSISNVTSFPLVPSGSPTLLATATASSSASLSFNSTYINGDYQVYKFEFINIHPQTDATVFQFNLSTDNGSNYNVTKTSTMFRAYHGENGAGGALVYKSDSDLAQSTSFQELCNLGNDNDQSCSGSLTLFNPSSTYVKHWIATVNYISEDNYSQEWFNAGYGNTTSAVNSVRFQISSGNIDAGQIKLYGLGAN